MAEQRPEEKASGGDVSSDGATAMFGFFEGDEREAMASPAVPATPAPLPVAAPVGVSAPTSGDGAGFTQLLRALVPGPEAAAVPSERKSVPSPVTHYEHVEQPKRAPEASAGGFTEMFGAQGGGSEAPEAQWPRPVAPGTSGGPKNESFTSMFGSQSAVAASPVAAGPVSSSPGVGSAAPAGPVFSSGSWPTVQLPSVEAAPIAPPTAVSRVPVAASTPPGEFTQLFQALDSKPTEALPVFSSPLYAPPASSPPSTPISSPVPLAGADSGGFTQLLRALDPGKGSVARSAAEAAPAATAGPAVSRPTDSRPAGESSGSFTQLFQALGPAPTSHSSLADPLAPVAGPVGPRSVAGPSPSGDGFTGLYSSLGKDAGRSESQADSFPPMVQPNGEPHASAPFYPAPEPVARPSAQRYPDPVYTPPAPAGSSLTQIIRSLDDPSAAAGQSAAQPVWREPQPVPQNATQNQYPYPGSYGGSYGEPGAAVTPQPPAGPGAFTKMIDAAQLREMERIGRQGGTGTPPAVPPAAQPGAPVQVSMPAMQYPPMPSSPSMPGFPTPPSAMPALPNAGQGGNWPMPMSPMQMPQAPAIPSPPAMPAAPAVPQGGMTKAWVPVLLIVIIVLLVGILAAVLLMKK